MNVNAGHERTSKARIIHQIQLIRGITVFQYRRYCGVNANDAERRGLWRCAAVQCGNGEDVHHQL
uniref:hypothetical protein n=1 Tax=Shigella dysenteriae TaxID=622 RepID=UPI00351A00F5